MAFNSANLIEDKIFKIFLKSKKLFYTYERQIILKGITIIEKTNRHFSIDDIYNHLAGKGNRVSKSTIYKTLKLVESCNLIKRIDITQDCYVYEKTDTHNIGHLICLKCGKIDELNQNTIKDLITQICKKESFKMKSHTFEIEGCCIDCLK